MGRSLEQDVADVMVWLDHAAAQGLLRLLVQEDRAGAFARLRQIAPDLDPGRAEEPAFFARLLDDLEQRVAPEDDLFDLETREMPNLERFAREPATEEGPHRR